MPKIIREPAELMALPVGTEAVDREGDYLRRSALGWTYRPAGQTVLQADIMAPGTLALYMPMVVTTATVQAPGPDLDDPDLVTKLAAYLTTRYPGATDPYPAANTILRLIKEHTT